MVEESQQLETLAVIRLIGQQEGTNAIPAEVLVRTLSGMQHLLYLIASDTDNRKVSQRFRVANDIEQRYQLICQVPKAGSYAVPLTLSNDPSDALQLSILPDQRCGIFDKIEHILESVASGKFELIQKEFSDRSFAKRAIIEIRKFLPNADDSWKFGFSKKQSNREIVLAKESIKHIDCWLSQEVPSESTVTLTGELIRIDFDERKVYLRYPPTRQVIECIYSEDIEDAMIENRRQYIQVTGQFTLDSNGFPIKLTEVSRIEPLDLSPIVLTEVCYKERKFVFQKPMKLIPTIEESEKQLLAVEQSELGINAFASTREELLDEIAEQIAFLWDEYALAEEATLTPEAKQLKQAVLNSVEAPDAA